MEVFRLLGRIGLDGAAEVEGSLEDVEGKAEDTGGSFRDLGKRTQALGKGMTKFVTGPIAALTAGIVGLAVEAGNYADQILDTSAATGMATETIQEYQAVARIAGVNTN